MTRQTPHPPSSLTPQAAQTLPFPLPLSLRSRKTPFHISRYIKLFPRPQQASLFSPSPSHHHMDTYLITIRPAHTHLRTRATTKSSASDSGFLSFANLRVMFTVYGSKVAGGGRFMRQAQLSSNLSLSFPMKTSLSPLRQRPPPCPKQSINF